MTLEGGKPLVENSDEVGWTAAAFDYYAEIGRDSAGQGDSLDRGDPAVAGGQGAGRRRRLHRPLELSAAAPGLEAGAGAGRRKHHRLQAVGADAALDPGAGAVLRAPARGRRQPARRGGRGRRADRRRRGRRLRRLHRARSRPASGSPPPARSGSRAINLEMGGKDPFIVCSDVAERIDVAAKGGAWAAFLNAGPGLHLRRALLRDGGRLRRLPAGVRRLHRGASGGRPDWTRATDVGPMVSAAQRQKVARPGRGGGRRRRRGRDRRRRRRPASADTSSPRRWSPARRPRPTCSARRHSGRWRRSSR